MGSHCDLLSECSVELSVWKQAGPQQLAADRYFASSKSMSSKVAVRSPKKRVQWQKLGPQTGECFLPAFGLVHDTLNASKEIQSERELVRAEASRHRRASRAYQEKAVHQGMAQVLILCSRRKGLSNRQAITEGLSNY